MKCFTIRPQHGRHGLFRVNTSENLRTLADDFSRTIQLLLPLNHFGCFVPRPRIFLDTEL